MSIDSCIGTKNKERILAEYTIAPLSHLVLLPGQVKQGCAGPLTRCYYAFEYTSKSDPSHSGVFFCGDHAANEFLVLIGRGPLPLFNPLVVVAGGGGGGGGVAPAHAAMTPLNVEVYNAIHLIFALTGGTPKGGMLATLEFIRQNPTRTTDDWAVVRVNNYAAKCPQIAGTIVATLAAVPGTRAFNFPLICAILLAKGLTNHIQ